MSRRIQAPRGTYDVLGEQALARDALEGHARTILERAGYQRIETPVFEATELFARGVGASTDVVQKEMYTFDDGDSESITLRPEGTAPVCRAYMEHGMHKLPQPVKLWYFGSFFRRERPQKGRFRQFWQIGAEAIGSDDPAVDAEAILLLAEILEAAGVAGAAADLEPRHAAEPPALPRQAAAVPARATRRELSEDVVARIDLNPLRAFDSDHPGTRARDGRRAAAARRARPRGLRALRRRARHCSTRPISRTRSTPRSCAAWTTTRARCSSSRPPTSARSPASAAAGATTG